MPQRPNLIPTHYELDPNSSPYNPKWMPVYATIEPEKGATMTPDDMLDVALDTGIDHAIMAMHDNPDLCFDLDLLDEQVHPEAFGEVLNQPWSERLEANALSQAVHDGIKYAFINADTED